MDSFYAPAGRADAPTLAAEIKAVDSSLVVSALLKTISGLVAIVNEQRQVVAVNATFLSFLGVQEPELILGLRPGEIVKCVHSGEYPDGCGTTRYCSTCGAAIAMVTSFAEDMPAEKVCTLAITRNGQPVDLVLKVEAKPITIDHSRFLMLFLLDITRHEQQAALERTFFHDINNTVNMLVGTCDLLAKEVPGRLTEILNTVSTRLVNEITLQCCLSNSFSQPYTPQLSCYLIGDLLNDLKASVVNHEAARTKQIDIDGSLDREVIVTDRSLLLRIVCNMVINAFEAIAPEATVRVWISRKTAGTTFHVWNGGSIPPDIALRIFQRYFSTKAQSGRGLGTYSMKLFGEKYLGGSVGFSSSPEEGTEFWITLPENTEDDVRSSAL